MKKYHLVFTVLLLQAFAIYSQDNYLINIAEESCQCVSELPDGEDLTNVNLGLCIINEAIKYKEELLRDHDINMANIDVEGEKLGKLVALEMFARCPEQMKRIVGANVDEDNKENDDFQSMEGVIKSITLGDFIVFSITADDGKTSKFYWLTFIESDNDLQNEYENFKEKRVRLEYSIIELYDARLGEYRNYNLINSLNIIN